MSEENKKTIQQSGVLTVEGKWEKTGYPSLIIFNMNCPAPTLRMTPTVAENLIDDIYKVLNTWKWI